MPTKSRQIKVLGSVSLGTTFVYSTVDLFGAEHATERLPPFEGKTLTVVGFKPRYVNQVIVQDPAGYQSLMPLYMVEKALTTGLAATSATENSGLEQK